MCECIWITKNYSEVVDVCMYKRWITKNYSEVVDVALR